MEFVLNCPDPAAGVEMAERLVLFADLDRGREALTLVEAAFACGTPAEPATLARMWIVEGALSADSGDPGAAAAFYASARRVAPEVWVAALGPQKRASYEAAVSGVGRGGITIDAPVGVTGTTWVDGDVALNPILVVPGPHLVQFGVDGHAWFAQRVEVSDAQVFHVQVPAGPSWRVPLVAELDAPPTVSLAAPAPTVSVARTHPYVHLAVGTNLTFGGDLSRAPDFGSAEGGMTVTLPLELGGGVAGKVGWVRAAASVAPVLSGYSPSPFVLGGHLAGGLCAGPLDVGLLGGYSWEDEFATRLVVGVEIPGAPVEFELRAGVNLPADRSVERAATLVIAFPGTRLPAPPR